LADKPGSVVGNHSSGTSVTGYLKQPTRLRRGPRQRSPIWSCSEWGLPYRSVARLAVRSYRTISPLPLPSPKTKALRRYLSVALSVGSRRPGVTWHSALWSPDFPPSVQDRQRLPGQLNAQVIGRRRSCPPGFALPHRNTTGAAPGPIPAGANTDRRFCARCGASATAALHCRVRRRSFWFP